MTRAILLLVFLALAGTVRAEDRTYCKKGLKAYLASNYELAVANYNACIIWGDLSPEIKSKAFYGRGIAYYHWGQRERAIENFDQALQLDPDNAVVLNDRGRIYTLKGNYDQAIADFDRAIDLQPDLAQAFVNRAAAYGEMGQFDQAIDDSDQAIRLKPDFAMAFKNKAVALNQ